MLDYCRPPHTHIPYMHAAAACRLRLQPRLQPRPGPHVRLQVRLREELLMQRPPFCGVVRPKAASSVADDNSLKAIRLRVLRRSSKAAVETSAAMLHMAHSDAWVGLHTHTHTHKMQ